MWWCSLFYHDSTYFLRRQVKHPVFVLVNLVIIKIKENAKIRSVKIAGLGMQEGVYVTLIVQEREIVR